ncbi:MAG: response regulator transcription factor [Nitriliruptorales bacterium]|nr:response regulator transcription factor [Nitriliruptorales bacterium]
METAASTTQPIKPRTGTTTAVVVDDRPLVRAGLATILEHGDEISVVAANPLVDLVASVRAIQPSVVVVGIPSDDDDPFRAIAAANAVTEQLYILALTDRADGIDLREAVIAGVDSFLLTSSSATELRDAAIATARGERIVSPEIAMELAGSWRSDPTRGRQPTLTPREAEVLALIAEGMTNQQVGIELGLSARTIKTHVQNLLTKLNAPDRTGAVARAFRTGLLR